MLNKNFPKNKKLYLCYHGFEIHEMVRLPLPSHPDRLLSKISVLVILLDHIKEHRNESEAAIEEKGIGDVGIHKGSDICIPRSSCD